MPFLTLKQIESIGFRKTGNNLQISDAARFYNPGNISIGHHVRIDDFSILSAGSNGIVLENYVHIGCFCFLTGSEEIRMQNFSGLSSRVAIYSSSDDYSGASMTNPTVPVAYRRPVNGRVDLGVHVVIGTCSTILPGVQIGKGSAIGAYSMVTQNVGDSVVAAGVPCRMIKTRLTDLFHEEQKFRDQSWYDNTSPEL